VDYFVALLKISHFGNFRVGYLGFEQGLEVLFIDTHVPGN
jgi:hypothetical protein